MKLEQTYSYQPIEIVVRNSRNSDVESEDEEEEEDVIAFSSSGRFFSFVLPF